MLGGEANAVGGEGGAQGAVALLCTPESTLKEAAEASFLALERSTEGLGFSGLRSSDTVPPGPSWNHRVWDQDIVCACHAAQTQGQVLL